MDPAQPVVAGSAGAPVDPLTLDSLRAEVQKMEGSLLHDLAALVNTDSGTHDKAGVDAVGNWVQGFLAELGGTMEVRSHNIHGNTIVATFPGAGRAGVRLLLLAHLDTVFEAGTARRRPFRVENGRAFGPGVVDMKGGLLVGLYALRALSRIAGGVDQLPLERVVFLINGDEEIGSPSSAPHIQEVAGGADVAFGLEAARANGDIVSARNGIVDLRIAINGRAAHAGVEPTRGRNAIVAAARIVDAIQGITGGSPGLAVNVGTISGGTRTNVVAERCVVDLEFRAASTTVLDEAEAWVRDSLPSLLPDGVSMNVEVLNRVPPMERLPGIAPVIAHALRIAGMLGMQVQDVATGGGSDANFTASLGVPTLDGLGPVGGGDHSEAEYLELESLTPRATLLAALILAVALDPACRRLTPDPPIAWLVSLRR